jgi:tetratricopeptide (TPR) repeat protein
MTRKSEDQSTRPTFSDEDIRKAREWFSRGQDMASKKNYDYAIECYLQGLGFWPDAVDEGHKPCYAAALFRGPKKVGFADSMKLKSARDPKTAMLLAEGLLCKEVRNPHYMEVVFRNAAKARFDATAMWIGEMLNEAAMREEKTNPARFQLLREVYEQLGDANADSDVAFAIAAYERGLDALSKLRNLKPQDMTIGTELRDLAGKLTILKGRYSSADSFRDSIKDTEVQKELHDRDRLVQGDERLDELIAHARATYEANPTDRKAVIDLAELMCRREDEREEREAIGILVKAYKETNEYSYRQRAEDIRIRQLRRKQRELESKGDRAAIEQHLREQVKFELDVFKSRIRHYPTDMRLRYRYGELLFRAGQYDEAIPVLQEARNDPKYRFQCSLYIGRCFYKKALYSPAIDTFKEAIAGYETPDDATGKELHYWLGRCYEADNQMPEALKTYGQLIQWDYNYRDVRKRIDDLKGRP